MLNFSDCYVAKVKSFFGLKSIDPPVPFDEFLQNNFKDLQQLIKNNQIIVLDGQGNEIDVLLLENYIHASYEKVFKNINLDRNKKDNKVEIKNERPEIQKELDRIKKINIEEKAKFEHKKRLIDSLQGCDQAYRITLEKGIERNDDKIKALQEERQSLLNSIGEIPISKDS